MKKGNNKGFTLVEIIVVLVVLSIMAAIATPAVMGYVSDAKDSQYLSEARNVLIAANAEASKLKANDELTKENLNALKSKILEKAKVDGEITYIRSDDENCDYFVYKAKDVDKWVRYTKNPEKMEVVKSIGKFGDAATMETIVDIFNSMTQKTLDSTAIVRTDDEAKIGEFIAKLKAAGIDLEEMGATYWRTSITNNQQALFWTPTDITKKNVGDSVYTMKYNMTSGNYYVVSSTVSTRTYSGVTYNVLLGEKVENAYRIPDGQQTYENAQKMLDKVLAKN